MTVSQAEVPPTATEIWSTITGAIGLVSEENKTSALPNLINRLDSMLKNKDVQGNAEISRLALELKGLAESGDLSAIKEYIGRIQNAINPYN